ncbi:MAG: serine/threonine phosphatase [Microcystaceae cyanobacterium]
MLICPQCHAENPNRNNFCQKCGVSLTHHDCHHCGTSVLLSEPHCPNCGAVTGKVLTLLLRNSDSTAATIPYPERYDHCIDIGQRYRLLAQETPEAPLQARQVLSQHVVDCQPLQPSVLKILLSQQTDFLTQLPTLQSWDENPTWQELRLPPLAFPYFKLRDHNPTIPDVYDAWCEGNYEFVLLIKKTAAIDLAKILAEEPLPPLQLLFWINQTLSLWELLSPLQMTQSLLVADNLNVDEDQNLCLGQLLDNGAEPPTLAQLGEQWQTWLAQPPQSPPDSLQTVLQQIRDETLKTPADCKLQLETLMTQLDPPQELETVTVSEVFDLELLEEDWGSSPPSTLPDANTTRQVDLDDVPTAVLPMQLVSLNDSGYTDRGRQRPHNEDYFGMTTDSRTQRNNQGRGVEAKGLYVVCDGMGGHAAGEVASQMAVNTLQEFFQEHWQDHLPSAETIAAGVLLANDAIFGINQQNASSGSGRMGTTLVMALVQNTKVAIAHVGDSRIYRITRKGGIEQMTVDHEVGQQAIQHGLDPKIAYARPDAYQLTQALGPHDSQYIHPDIRFWDVEEDTLILLCSDGISDNELIEENWENQLLPLLSSSQDVERGLRKFMEFANEHNGHDNLTGVLVRLKVAPQVPINLW